MPTTTLRADRPPPPAAVLDEALAAFWRGLTRSPLPTAPAAPARLCVLRCMAVPLYVHPLPRRIRRPSSTRRPAALAAASACPHRVRTAEPGLQVIHVARASRGGSSSRDGDGAWRIGARRSAAAPETRGHHHAAADPVSSTRPRFRHASFDGPAIGRLLPNHERPCRRRARMVVIATLTLARHARPRRGAVRRSGTPIAQPEDDHAAADPVHPPASSTANRPTAPRA